MKNETPHRLSLYRALMEKHGVAAAIVPQADPHMSEYLASHWQVRRWLSGFTGSAGDLVVTADSAALWTDSRYFLQAAAQLEGSGIELMKDGLEDTPTIADYLCGKLRKGDTVGIDGMLFAKPAVDALRKALDAKGIKLVTDFDVIDEIWTDRPAMPSDKIYLHSEEYAGESTASKIERILADAAAADCTAVLQSDLGDIAWTLNIRSNDVRYTPVASAFTFLTPESRTLFTDDAKLTDEVRAYLAANKIDVKGYNDIKSFLGALPADIRVLINSAATAAEISNILGTRAVDGGVTAAARFKSVKNDTQIACVRRVMERDGAALVRAFMELEDRIAKGIHTTEMDVDALLHKYRSQGENFKDLSFGTIAGYGPHGAIVHYEADEESNSTLEPHGLLLIDSGAQYTDGTTDITRTIALGTPTADEREHFTLVMKGHIALAQAVFPTGTRGAQLDALARQFLWKHGLNYLHGTGHGVGFFLSVHEGPHSIRLNNVEAPLRPGSITSNEPGVYLAGVHGIRCENLVLCRPCMTTDFGTFLHFETLTLFPFDLTLFDTALMTDDEIAWLNAYHDEVRRRLSPYLNAEERAWLEAKTEKLTR